VDLIEDPPLYGLGQAETSVVLGELFAALQPAESVRQRTFGQRRALNASPGQMANHPGQNDRVTTAHGGRVAFTTDQHERGHPLGQQRRQRAPDAPAAAHDGGPVALELAPRDARRLHGCVDSGHHRVAVARGERHAEFQERTEILRHDRRVAAEPDDLRTARLAQLHGGGHVREGVLRGESKELRRGLRENDEIARRNPSGARLDAYV